MKKILLTSSFLLLLQFLWGQHQGYPAQSPCTFIYKISADEAAFIYQQDKEWQYNNVQNVLQDRWLHTLVDTVCDWSVQRTMDSGHYIYVNAVAEKVYATLQSFYNYEVKVLEKQQDLALVVLDSLGNLMSEAKVWLEEKNIPFHKKSQSWQLNKQKKGGFLKVLVNGETLFYELEADNKPRLIVKRWQRFKSTPIGRVLSFPGRMLKRLYWTVKIGIQERRLVNPFRRNKSNPWSGYVMLNKPKFQPGDSLKMKAYIASKGKPFSGMLQLSLHEASYHYKALWTKDIEPSIAGDYQLEMVLADSLKLDKFYHLVFRDKKGKVVRDYSFYYEDYQLDEVIYTFENRKNSYTANEKVAFVAKAKDHNGFAAPDASVKISLYSQQTEDFYSPQLLIPDTIWRTEVSLSLDGESTIMVPDSILPKAKMDLGAIAWFRNSNGELQKKELSFSIDKNPLDIEFYKKDGFIYAHSASDSSSVLSAELLRFEKGHEAKKEKISLPFRLKVNPLVKKYRLKSGDFEAALEIKEVPIEVTGFHRGDSLFFQFKNSSQLPIRFDLFETKKKIASGSFDKEIYRWQSKANKDKAYFLEYQYLWGNKTEKKYQNFYFYKKLLQIEVEQPEVVEPGETANIKIKVKDADGKGAPNVQLAATAINSQFEWQHGHYKAPEIQYKRSMPPLAYPDLRLERHKFQNIPTVLSKKWYKQLGLDSLLFYQFHFPENGVQLQYDTINTDTFYQNVAQFAPYLVKNGQFQPIYLIYCNRKLVWYYGSDDYPPYSFVGQAGKNDITIRGRDIEITIEKVELKKGWKLELVIDQNNFHQSEWASQIKVRPVQPELSQFEKTQLNRSIFLLRNMKIGVFGHLWQDEYSIHRFQWRPSGQYMKIGPFASGTPLYFMLQGHYLNKFRFESGFSYNIASNRERLYESNIFHSNKKITLPPELPVQIPGALIYHPKDIQRYAPLTQKVRLKYPERRHRKGRAKYHFEFEQSDTLLHAVVLVDTFAVWSFYQPSTREFRALRPQQYEMYLFTKNGNYAKHQFVARRDTLLYEDLSELPFTIDSSKALFLKHFYEIDSLMSGDSLNLEPPLGMYQTMSGGNNLSGKVLDSTGEPILFGNVALYRNGIIVTGTQTDFDGNYFIPNLAPGIYDIAFSYVGYQTKEIKRLVIKPNVNNRLNVEMDDRGIQLEEVVVVAYSVPLIEQDNTSQGKILTSNDIRALPTRNISALAGRTAGIMISESNAINIRGMRTSATNYYIDGIRVIDGVLTETQTDTFDNSYLRSDFSDNAFWQPILITDKNGEATFKATFPDNITEWSTTVLGMDKKQQAGTGNAKTKAYKTLVAQLAVPRFLIEGDETNVIGKALNFSKDTMSVKTAFRLNGENIQQKDQRLETAVIENTTIQVAENSDSLALSYLLFAGQKSDGEKRNIPIFPKGVEETTGHFWVLDKDTSFQLPFEAEEDFTFYAQDNALEVFLDNIKYLENYPYGCTEQTASRLIAFLLKKQIQQQLGQSFEKEEAIIKAIQRLRQTQNEDGSWGWWRNGKTNYWMTIYALKALATAKQAGYETIAFEKGIRFLMSILHNLEEKNLLDALRLLAELDYNADYKKHLAKFDSLDLSLYEQFSIVRIRQQRNLEYSLDTLTKYRKETLFGSYYWGEQNYQWYDNAHQLTLLAYHIFEHEKQTSTTAKIRQYFLENRKRNGWRNTFETAQILRTILPHFLNENKALTVNQIQLSGGITQKVDKFPTQINIKNSSHAVHLIKTGSSPLFVTAFQEQWNKNPKPKADLFEIETSLYQGDKEVQELKQESPVILKIKLQVKKAANYVMLEVPIPAGCSYEQKTTARYPEVHREYFKEKVAIFYEKLPVGEYELKVRLEPRFSGQYTLNPAKGEEMYFPVFFGRNQLKKIGIK